MTAGSSYKFQRDGRHGRMKKLFAFLILACAAAVGAQPLQVQWQSSEHPSVRLAVRDKGGELGRYEATFVVTEHPSGKKFDKTITVEGDNFGSVTFPEDFSDFSNSYYRKRYTWTCTVNGEVVLRGRFILGTTSDLDPNDNPVKGARRKRGRQ